MSITINEVVGGRDKSLQNVLNQINTNFTNVKSGTDSDVDRIDTTLNNLFAFGVYTGNGVDNREINLGYRPKAVLVVRADGALGLTINGFANWSYGGLALDGYAGGANGIEISQNGFTVSGDCNREPYTSPNVYYYIAIKSDSEIVVHS